MQQSMTPHVDHVAPPRGVRGLKCPLPRLLPLPVRVAPPRGVRGLKSSSVGASGKTAGVAPPRGVRGLKLFCDELSPPVYSRTPSWGAWIEIIRPYLSAIPTRSHPLVGCVD